MTTADDGRKSQGVSFHPNLRRLPRKAAGGRANNAKCYLCGGGRCARVRVMFDLTRYLESQRRLIDAALDREMPSETERPVALHRAMRYSVLNGGKRLRPVLCIAAAEALGAPAEAALPSAMAAELLHAYTLVHDDLPCMDDAAERRGKPTVHVAFGEAMAVLTGDALQALAFEMPIRNRHCRPQTILRHIAELARAAGSQGVIGGQVEDLAAMNGTPSAETMAYIHLHKTADLFRAAVRMGAIAGAADEPSLAAFTRYAECLGLAFQLSDDLLDEHQKAPDEKQEASCLQVMDRTSAERKTHALTAEAIVALDCFAPGLVEPLVAIARLVAERIEPIKSG